MRPGTHTLTSSVERTGDARAHTSLYVVEHPTSTRADDSPSWCLAPAPSDAPGPTDEVRERLMRAWFGSWEPRSLLHEIAPRRTRTAELKGDGDDGNLEEHDEDASPDEYSELSDESLVGQNRDMLFGSASVRVGSIALPLETSHAMSATITSPPPRTEPRPPRGT